MRITVHGSRLVMRIIPASGDSFGAVRSMEMFGVRRAGIMIAEQDDCFRDLIVEETLTRVK